MVRYVHVRKSVTALGTIVVALVAVVSAHAETPQAISARVGYATFSALGKASGSQPPPSISPTGGGAIAFSYERTLSTEVSLRGSLAAGLFLGGGTSYYGEAAVGVTFRFDVLKYVPYAFAQVGGIDRGGGKLPSGIDAVLCLGGGVDILSSRSRSWGIEGQLSSFGGSITVFTIGLRGTHRWGFF
jgi:hypothetical protein